MIWNVPAALTSLPTQIGLREHLPDLRLRSTGCPCAVRWPAAFSSRAMPICVLPARAISNIGWTTATSAGRGVSVPDPSPGSNPNRRGPPFDPTRGCGRRHATTACGATGWSDSCRAHQRDRAQTDARRPRAPRVDAPGRRRRCASVASHRSRTPPLGLLAAAEPILRVDVDRLDAAGWRSGCTSSRSTGPVEDRRP